VNAQPQNQQSVRESLVLLTRDEQLVHLVRCVATDHELFTVDAEVDLPIHLKDDHAGVAMLDADAVQTPIAELVERLKAQFPQLVLVVAGDAAVLGTLLKHISDGSVFRFLHKPISEQRLMQFVNSAWRRHDQEPTLLRFPQASAAASFWESPRTMRAALLGTGALATLILAFWTWSGIAHWPGRGSHAQAALEDLLARADRALLQGHLVTPAGESAVDLYALAHKMAADDPRVRAGIDQLMDRLLSQAERALLDQRIEDAAQLTDAARAIEPDSVRVVFLRDQIGKERERVILAQANEAAAKGDVQRAIAALDNAVPTGQGSALVTQARQEFEQQKVDKKVRDYLERAAERMRAGALVKPAQNNAQFLIESARSIAPNSPEVRLAQQQLADRVVAEAHSALAAGDIAQGERWIAVADEVGVSSEELATLKTAAQRLNVSDKADGVQRLSSLFYQRLTQAMLIEPASDSAKFYLAQLVLADADNPITLLASRAFSARLLDEARAAAGRREALSARLWLSEATLANADAASVAAIQQSLDTTSAAADAADGAGTLKRIRYVKPIFPKFAEEKDMAGWVDLRYVVREDGTVDDVKVTGAQPAGIFDNSAITAVSQWRYNPVGPDDHRADTRMTVRIRFAR
jgi:protein TonB